MPGVLFEGGSFRAVFSCGVMDALLDNDIMCLAMPLKVHDLVNTVDLMCQTITRRRRKAKAKLKGRRPEEEALIRQAKEVLIARNNMTEQEAYRYIQKCSMDSSTNMVETAQMVLTMMRN
jgi:response regulator NasT